MHFLLTLQIHERKCFALVAIEDEQSWDAVDPFELIGERLSSLDQRDLRFRAGEKLLHALSAFVAAPIHEPIDGHYCNVFFITAFAHRIQGFELPSAVRAPAGKNVTMTIFLSVSPRACDPFVGSALSVLRKLSSNCRGARASAVVCRPMSNANVKVSIFRKMDYRCSCRYLELTIS